jgi:Arc/MetJ-type ribon-helix-helix transcriptional regulator
VATTVRLSENTKQFLDRLNGDGDTHDETIRQALKLLYGEHFRESYAQLDTEVIESSMDR